MEDRRSEGLKGSLNEEKLQHFCGFFPNWDFWRIFSILKDKSNKAAMGG
jgi:hypothetical protein